LSGGDSTQMLRARLRTINSCREGELPAEPITTEAIASRDGSAGNSHFPGRAGEIDSERMATILRNDFSTLPLDQSGTQ
jgi:hypothetical protein